MNAFTSEGGKRVLVKLRSLTTYDRSSIRPNEPIDTNRLIYDEGQRAVIIYIMKQLRKDLHKDKQTEARS